MRPCHFVSIALAALLLAACAAPTSSQDAPVAKPVAAQPATPSPAMPSPAAPAPAASPIGEAPGGSDTLPAIRAGEPSRACRTNADCAVRDVGNCCGAYPMCVNKDAKTDPAAVRAQCERSGTASICGFQEVSGCQCVKGQCENIAGGAVVM